MRRRCPTIIIACGGGGAHGAKRHVIQTVYRDNSVSQTAQDAAIGREIRSRAGNKIYRKHTPLWEHVEAHERDLTVHTYEPKERLAPQLEPRSRVTTLLMEGPGAEQMMLDEMQEQVAETTNTELAAAHQQQELSNDQQQQQMAMQIIEEDLSYNTVGVASWEQCGLDPTMAALATERFGPTATRVQSRLLPALLNDAHNDVIMNGVTGSGKTAALLLAALQGIRNEDSGVNVVLCSNSMLAKRAYDTVVSLCGQRGGTLIDREKEDMSWLHCCEFIENVDKSHRMLKNSLRKDEGATRLLVTTPDVLAELLFKHKMEFVKFGYLRRVYADDAAAQMKMVKPDAMVAQVMNRLKEPRPLELVLGTLHQLPGPNIRSVMQMAAVSADMDTQLKDHLNALCIKQQAKTIILSPTRLPTTLHCLFSFPTRRQDGEPRTALVKLLRNAFPTIPGHCIIFIRQEENLMEAQHALRRLGMDAKLLHEVYDAQNETFRRNWKFLLLHEADAPGLDIPFVSHVVITFCPSNRFSYLHMAGRVGRLGNVGWVYTVTDRTEAKNVADVVKELDVDVEDHCITTALMKVDKNDVHSWTKEPSLYGMDPQYIVEAHYEKLQSPTAVNIDREIFDHPVEKTFQLEDYTPTRLHNRKLENARNLHKDIARDPKVVEVLQRRGLLDEYLRPTKKLEDSMFEKRGTKQTPSPYGGVMD